MSARERIHFVTGKLAEPALREVVAELAPRAGFDYSIEALGITVAALMTTDWVAKRVAPPPESTRVMLPGYCSGDVGSVAQATGLPVERGPKELRDLPEHFGRAPVDDYGGYSIEIVAEINHAPRLAPDELLRAAESLRRDGADVIDLGCEPGRPWSGLADAVRRLRDAGLRVSVDTFDPDEAAAGARAGAELVLSVTGATCERAADWGCEVVVVPDRAGALEGFEPAVDRLTRDGVRFRLDPILDPIGIGLAASVGRYLETRRRWPESAMLMGVGNLTELTDADSAAINVLLLGMCAELGIGSVLTTQEIHWARNSVRECDLARRLVDYAVRRRVPPKRLEPRLIPLRGDRPLREGPESLDRLAASIRDHNLRIFAEDEQLHLLTDGMRLSGDDPFELFAQLASRLTRALSPEHAFYLGYEMSKAMTALTLGKRYRQDEALEWGYLTRPEESHRRRDEP